MQGEKTGSNEEELKRKRQEMNTAEVRKEGVVPVSDIEGGVTRTDGSTRSHGSKKY